MTQTTNVHQQRQQTQRRSVTVGLAVGASSTGSECTAAVGKSGQVFGLPLAKCIANDMALRKDQDWLSNIWTSAESSPLTTKPSLRHR